MRPRGGIRASDSFGYAPSPSDWRAGPLRATTNAGVHDDVPENDLLKCLGDMGGVGESDGRWGCPSPCRYHAAHECALCGTDRRFDRWGSRTCPVHRGGRVAKANPCRQAGTNSVPLLPSRTLSCLIGEIGGLPSAECAGSELLDPAWPPGSQLTVVYPFVEAEVHGRPLSWSIGNPRRV